MATEITNLTNAIQELIRKITGSTTSSATSATSTGIVQGVAEAAVTATVINTGSNKMVEAVKTMNDNFKAFVPIKSQAFSSGSTGSRKVDPDGPIGVGVINGPPGSKPAKPPEKDPKEEKEKGVGMLTRFTSWIKKASVALGAFVAIGMRNTVEGYKLGLAFDRLSYQLADAMHYPIVYLTSAINQIAAEFNYLNKIPFARSIMSWAGMLLIGSTALMGLWKVFGPVITGLWSIVPVLGRFAISLTGLTVIISALTALLGLLDFKLGSKLGKDLYQRFVSGKPDEDWGLIGIDKPKPRDDSKPAPEMREFGGDWKETDRFDPETQKWQGKDSPTHGQKLDKEEEHNKPLYQTSFMQLTALWETMNKAVTENPGLDVVSSWLEKIFNKMPEPDKGGNPQPRAQGAVAP